MQMHEFREAERAARALSKGASPEVSAILDGILNAMRAKVEAPKDRLRTFFTAGAGIAIFAVCVALLIVSIT